MFNKLLLVFLMVFGISSCSSCNSKMQKKVTISTKFKAPEPPIAITDKDMILKFMINNYWNKFNYSDTTQISDGDFIEGHFYNYVNICSSSDPVLAKQQLKNVLDNAYNASIDMYKHFITIFEKYYYHPNSPFRSEEMYIVGLEHIIKAAKIGDVDKVRPMYHYEMVLKNRVGELSTDFTYTMVNGVDGNMHDIIADYTLLFFNSPDCENCMQLKELIPNQPIFQKLINAKKSPNMKILAMYVDSDLMDLWKETKYPKNWINGYDKLEFIKSNEAYSIPATPCFYLLDRDKKVIFKDIDIEQLTKWLIEKHSYSGE